MRAFFTAIDFALARATGFAVTGLDQGAVGLQSADDVLTLRLTEPTLDLMALSAVFIVALAETGRVPVDNPATHLELTMIHEAMVLEYSGRYLALLEWASAIKLLVFLTLIANVFAPWGIATSFTPMALSIGLAVYLIKVAGLALLIGTIECMFAKLRLFRVTDLLGVAFILALLGLLFFYMLRG